MNLPFFRKKSYTLSYTLQTHTHTLQTMENEHWFKIISFLDLSDLKTLSIAYTYAARILFKGDLSTFHLFFTQTFTDKIEAQCSLKAGSLNNENTVLAKRKYIAKNLLSCIAIFSPLPIGLTFLGIKWKEANSTKSDFINNVLKPTCTIQWSHFDEWFREDNSCTALFNCTASLCSRAESYADQEDDYLLSLILLSVVLGTIYLLVLAVQLARRCEIVTIENVRSINSREVMRDYPLSDILTLTLQKRLASFLNGDLNEMASRPVETVVEQLRVIYTQTHAVSSQQIPDWITNRLKEMGELNSNQFFGSYTRSNILINQPNSNSNAPHFM